MGKNDTRKREEDEEEGQVSEDALEEVLDEDEDEDDLALLEEDGSEKWE